MVQDKTGNLTAQFINCPELNRIDIEHLQGLQRLTHLDLRLSRITPDILLSIFTLQSVTSLDLASTRITDFDLALIARQAFQGGDRQAR